jgi:DNA helicase-2/ATP-dependent DNA helicase PcrA
LTINGLFGIFQLSHYYLRKKKRENMDLSLFNESQREAVTLPSDVKELKDILIVAGAGSGKTRVVVYRIAYLIEVMKIDPREILGVTFTKKAGNEMQSRLASLFTKTTPVKLGTFHALAADLLRTFLDYKFDIIDDSDQSRMLRNVIKDLGLKDEVTLKEFKLWLSNQRNACLDPGMSNVSDNVSIQNNRKVARHYKKAKVQLGAGVFDFDDLLEELVLMLESKPSIRSRLHARWKYILVDEYQDTNKRQFQIIKLIRGEGTQLLQVGDEDQLIYSWRGAEISHIMKSYQESLVNPNVRCVMLDINYRSTGNILSLANAVVSDNKIRTGKLLVANKSAGEPIKIWQFSNCNAEAEGLARQLERWSCEGYEYSEMAILMRTNRMARPIERALIQQGVAYKMHNGIALFDSKETKLLMSLLRFTENPAETFYLQGCLETIKMGIGEAKLKYLDDQRVSRNEDWITFLKSHPVYGTKSRVKEFIEFYHDAEKYLSSGEIASAARSWLNNWDLMQFFKEEERERKTETLVVFFGVVDDYEHEATLKGIKPSVMDFQEQRLLNDTLTDVDVEGVNLMSIHKSKGLEFKVGAIIGIQDGVFPMDTDSFEPENEEDWRLAYVAITRFMDDLVLTRANYRVGFNNISGHSSILDHHIESFDGEDVVICERR